MNYSTNYHCFLAASEHIRELIRLQIEDPDGEKVKLHLIIICVRLFFIILKNSSLLSIFESKAKLVYCKSLPGHFAHFVWLGYFHCLVIFWSLGTELVVV
jgi:hypothetical protein